jgi:hypothetical protein
MNSTSLMKSYRGPFGTDYQTVGCYVTETAIFCRVCGEARHLGTDEAFSIAETRQNFEDEYGAECSACGVMICHPDPKWAEAK